MMTVQLVAERVEVEPDLFTTESIGRTILVVDDNPLDCLVAGNLVAQVTGLEVRYANDGKQALAAIAKEVPALVLTDLLMPRMDGLELVEEMRCAYPTVPVVLMTARGSEEIAIAALRGGAANYVPKRCLAQDLPFILPQVLATARQERRRHRLLECIASLDCRFVLDNDAAMAHLLVHHLQEHALRMGLCDANGKIRLGIALEEALLNGIYHGNLEVSSDLRRDGHGSFERLVEQRRHLSPYGTRRLHVHARLSSDQAVFVPRDEGPGFDPTTLPDPTDPANMTRPSGRGLLLIRTFMDEVSHNASGNEITMIKWRHGHSRCKRKQERRRSCPEDGSHANGGR